MRKAAVAIGLLFVAGCSSGTDETTTGRECAATVHVFVEPGVTAQRERRIAEVIEGAPGVSESTFYSGRDAYKEFKALYQDQPEIYKTKRRADFPSRFEVTLTRESDFDLFERTVTGATTGIDRLVPGGCASPEGSP